MLSFPKADFKIVYSFLRLFPIWGLFFFYLPGVSASVLCQGEVTSAHLNVRALPSQSAKVLMVLKRGTPIDVLKIQGGIGGWLTISHGGKTGFVRHRPIYVKLLNSAPKKSSSNALKPPPPQSRRAIQRRILKEQKRLDAFKGEEKSLVAGLNAIDRAMDRARKEAFVLNRENRKLKVDIQDAMDTCEGLSLAIAKNQAYIEKRLVALHRLHMLGPMHSVGGDSFFDFLIKQNALKRILQYDFSVFDRQNKRLAKVDALEAQLKQQMLASEKLESEVALQLRIQEKEGLKKKRLLSEIKRKKELSQAALLALEESAALLNQKIENLGKTPIEKGDYHFSDHKGHLSNPVMGKIISSFGSPGQGQDKSFTFQSGIDIKVNRGDPIRSVFKGRIAFSDWLRGYGNLIIIDHGDNYYSLYAHVQDVFKKKGETVKTSEVIATAGDTGSIKGPCLHFEIRHHSRAVNPLKWLKKGT